MPYAFLPASAARPVITGKSAEAVPLGGTLTLTYTGTVTYAVIAAPGAVTHQVRARPRPAPARGCLLLPRPCKLRPGRERAPCFEQSTPFPSLRGIAPISPPRPT
jgi:hypothetical protein